MRGITAALKRSRSDERGVETAAMIFVLPVLIILVIGLIDIGWMIKTRMMVENIARDTVISAGREGGNYNAKARLDANGRAWDSIAFARLWQNGRCVQSACTAPPVVDCRTITSAGGGTYRANAAQRTGDLITCTVDYKYKPINGPLLNSPMGLGIGSMLKPFTITVTARADTNVSGRS